MTREFLKGLGLEDTAIESILSENEQDVNKEKQKTVKAKADLSDAQGQLATAQADLETLRQSSGDAAAIQQKYAELQAKYDADIADRDAQIAARDYDDAARDAVSAKGLKFSSKAAEGYFYSQLREKKLELKDGALTGFDDFLKAQQEADPYAFASDKLAPRFLGPVGTGGAPPAPISRAAQLAAEHHTNLYGAGKEST